MDILTELVTSSKLNLLGPIQVYLDLQGFLKTAIEVDFVIGFLLKTENLNFIGGYHLGNWAD